MENASCHDTGLENPASTNTDPVNSTSGVFHKKQSYCVVKIQIYFLSYIISPMMLTSDVQGFKGVASVACSDKGSTALISNKSTCVNGAGLWENELIICPFYSCVFIPCSLHDTLRIFDQKGMKNDKENPKVLKIWYHSFSEEENSEKLYGTAAPEVHPAGKPSCKGFMSLHECIGLCVCVCVAVTPPWSKQCGQCVSVCVFGNAISISYWAQSCESSDRAVMNDIRLGQKHIQSEEWPEYSISS